MSKVYKIGIIGVGRWGLNYLRTFNELNNASVEWICSTKESTIEQALSKIKLRKPIRTTNDYKVILADEEIDAVAIVTPGSTHYELAKKALQACKHTIVEKPPAFSSNKLMNLIKLSKKNRSAFFVSDIHSFNPAIQRLRNDIKKGKFGKINYILSFGFGNGPIRNDMSALWDFFPHDVSIILNLLNDFPVSVIANGASYVRKGIEDIVTMNLKFPGNKFSVAVASWLYPLKKRELTILGEKLYATFDDYAKKEKLKYFRNRLNEKGKFSKYCSYWSPVISNKKPLVEQLKNFFKCIEDNKQAAYYNKHALKVLKVLEHAEQSIVNNGQVVEIDDN